LIIPLKILESEMATPSLNTRKRLTASAALATLLASLSLAAFAQSYSGGRAPLFAPSAPPAAGTGTPGYGAGTWLPQAQSKAQVILIAPNDLATLPANRPFRIGFRTLGLESGDHLQLLIDGQASDTVYRNVGTHQIRYGLPEGLHVITLRVVDAEGRPRGHEQSIRLLMQ
jgi:hypothetical protein